MAKRTPDNHKNALQDFASAFRQQVDKDMAFWGPRSGDHAAGRQAAYAVCLRQLEEALVKNDLTLGHVSLSGYTVPNADEGAR